MTDERATETTEREEHRQEGENGEKSEVAKARKAAEEEEQAKQKVKDLEEDPPAKLEDWPDDKAKYETFGGAEGRESYEESVTSKLGPSSLRYREDGRVEIRGEEVDDPEKYKADPIPGGPTDPRIKDAESEVSGEGSDDEGSEGEKPDQES